MEEIEKPAVGAAQVPVAQPDTFACYSCNSEYLLSNGFTENGDMYCIDCWNENHFECNRCNLECHMDGLHRDDGDAYCGRCYDEIVAEYGGGFSYRPYLRGDSERFQSKDKGTIITSPRAFGVEIECYYPNSARMKTVCNELDRGIGIESDGSLNDNGIELQTPKLKGAAGERKILETCRILHENNFTVDKSAGLHVHLDGKGLLRNHEAIRQAWSLYHVAEPILHTFLPASRRTNTFAKPVQQFNLQDIQAAKNKKELEALWYGYGAARSTYHATMRDNEIRRRKSHEKDGSRYCGVNMHALFAMRHLEVRYHSGTINALKILYWIDLHQKILDSAAKKSLAPLIGALQSSETIETRTRVLFDGLKLSSKARHYFLKRQEKFLNSIAVEEN